MKLLIFMMTKHLNEHIVLQANENQLKALKAFQAFSYSQTSESFNYIIASKSEKIFLYNNL